VPRAVKRERSARLRAASETACRVRWLRRLGSEDTVVVDRPGRGYADDYTPWLLDAPVGAVVRARATGVAEEGILAVRA
jgi:threonylcarbamoyladenosine tRNA methylthiotransferase MtaB